MPLRKSAISFFLGIPLLVGLYVIQLENYLLFHSVVEIFSIVIAWGIFALAWNARRFLENDAVLLLGIAYLFIGVLDLAHTLAYKGMGVFHGYDADLATQLWIAARSLQSVSFLVAPLLIGRHLRVNVVLVSYIAVVSLLLGSIFYWDIFPHCFVEGHGLTPFKKISEYVISLMLLVSIGLFSRRRHDFDPTVLRCIIASIILTILSELAFTFYVDVYGLLNLIGHYLKVIASYLLYTGFIQIGLSRPYDLVFRSLKQSEDTLRKSESFVRAALNSLSANIAILDSGGAILEVNKAWSEFAVSNGLDDNLVGENYLRVCDNASGQWAQRAAEAAAGIRSVIYGEKGFFAMEYPCHSPEQERWFHMRVTRLAGSDPIRVVAAHENITDRKQAEAELIRARDEWERTFDAVPDLIMIIDNQYRVVRTNKAAAKRLGCRPDELVGLLCYRAVHGTDEPPASCPHKHLLADAEAHVAELSGDRLGGHHLVTVSPLFDLDGKLVGSVHVARDITDRKQAEESLRRGHQELERRVRESTRELRQSETELRRLSSELMKAHEEESKRIGQELHDGLAQSLSAIKIRVESALVQVGRENYSEVSRSLETIVPMTQNAVEEVRRISRNLWPHVLDDLGIVAAISWLCKEFETTYSKIGIEKQIQIREDDVAGDLKIIIFRVLQEALNNVVKHSRADKVKLLLHETNGRLELCVQDNGTGFNLDRLVSGASPQRGLGLASMRERTRLSGGSLVIESQEGRGTTLRATWNRA
jgi:PAS domain S-box-containing protein